MRRCGILIFFCMFFLQTVSCRLIVPSLKNDSDLISDFKPLEWSDDYVFGNTRYPPRISVWNSKTARLVRNYDFFKADSEESLFNDGGRWLMLYAMLVIEKNVWCIALGNQSNLVKIDVESGEVKRIALEKRYIYLVYIPEADGGRGGILLVPFAQYKEDVSIKLFSLNGDLLRDYTLSASDLDILTANGQYKDGFYYFCAGVHEHSLPGEPPSGIYKLVKLNLQSDDCEIISLQTEKILGKDFVKNNLPPEFYKESYLTSFSVKQGKSSDGNFMVAFDFLNSNDTGRFLFETPDLLSGDYSYTGKNMVSSKDDVEIFPRMYFKSENQYSSVGNYGGDLYAVFFNDSEKDIFFMPNAEEIFMDEKDDNVWCVKNSYSYSSESRKWIYDGDGIYKVDLKNRDVILYLNDGSRVPFQKYEK